jgi:hypothetical protein
MIESCPKCGGTAILVLARSGFEEFHDLDHPTEKVRVPVKVEEFRCQDPSCEHEFEKIIRESS